MSEPRLYLVDVPVTVAIWANGRGKAKAEARRRVVDKVFRNKLAVKGFALRGDAKIEAHVAARRSSR